MNNTCNIKKNNDGLSLIELIIVVAIMTVLGAALFLSTSVATDKHVTSCANKIAMAMEQTRSLTLGKQTGYIRLWQDASGEVYAQEYINLSAYGDEVSVGHSGLTVKLLYTDGTELNLNTVADVEIEFSRSTGSIYKYRIAGADSTKVLKGIEVNNGRKTVMIEIDRYTGRVNVL